MKAIHVAVACLLLVACGANYKEQAAAGLEAKDKAIADSMSMSNGFMSSTAAQVTKKDSTRKFIRTADMRFRAGNVYQSTYAIEDIINKHNGFVTLSNLHSTVSYTNKVAVSADSLLETTYFTVENTMSLRVPNVSLDSALKEIAAQIVFLDYRVITASDVSLQLMANTWSQRRAGRHHSRLENAIDTKARKLRETAEAEESLAQKEEVADYNRLNGLALVDQVNYSTINLQVYQREVTKKELIRNEKNIREYEPGLLSKMKDSLKDGWVFLEGLLVFLLKLWPLLPIALVLYILWKKYYQKK